MPQLKPVSVLFEITVVSGLIKRVRSVGSVHVGWVIRLETNVRVNEAWSARIYWGILSCFDAERKAHEGANFFLFLSGLPILFNQWWLDWCLEYLRWGEFAVVNYFWGGMKLLLRPWTFKNGAVVCTLWIIKRDLVWLLFGSQRSSSSSDLCWGSSKFIETVSYSTLFVTQWKHKSRTFGRNIEYRNLQFLFIHCSYNFAHKMFWII